ncbi:hypothetical protein HD554DRAFT_1988834, partial [Boletus coccyginus]
SELFMLNCWIQGYTPNSTFGIKTSPNEHISAVKQKIKDFNSDKLGDVTPLNLPLYKLNAPVPFDGLSTVILSTFGGRLTNALKVSSTFTTQPHKDHIHLIV